MKTVLSSGDLARATGETIRTVRFYEEQGLLKPAVAGEGRHRRYTEDDLERLRLVLDLREVGLSLGEIRTVLEIRAGCTTAAEFAARFQEALEVHVEQARRRLTRLRRVERELGQALATLRDRLAAHVAGCPCAVAEVGGAPRIVRIVARQGSCPHHAGSALDGDAVTVVPS